MKIKVIVTDLQDEREYSHSNIQNYDDFIDVLDTLCRMSGFSILGIAKKSWEIKEDETE